MVSKTVTVVIRHVVPMGSDTAAVAAQPKFKHITRELLEEFLDEDVLSDRPRELQYAKQHARETEGQFLDRVVALNAALGALLDGKELESVLLQGLSESLWAAARQYNTAGRSFTKLKANLNREGKFFRALHKVKLVPKPPAQNRLSLTPRSDSGLECGTGRPGCGRGRGLRGPRRRYRRPSPVGLGPERGSPNGVPPHDGVRVTADAGPRFRRVRSRRVPAEDSGPLPRTPQRGV